MNTYRLFPIAIFLLAPLLCTAQAPSRGAVLVGSVLGGQYQRPIRPAGSFYVDHFWGGRVDPMAAYFVTERLAVGAGFTFGLTLNSEDNITTFGGGPLARYYFNSQGRCRVFGQGGLAVLARKISAYDTHTAIGYAARVGATIFGRGRVAFEGTLGYDYVRSSADRIATHGLSAQLGVQVLLNAGH